MKLRYWSGALTLAFVLAGCGGEESAANADDPESAASVSATKSAANAASMYPTKSGVIEWKTETMGEITTVVYFDDHGAKQASYTNSEIRILGTTTTTSEVEITADGWTTKYDPNEKTGVRRRAFGVAGGGVANFPDIAELNRMKKGGYDVPDIEELPARTILGKVAKGYAVNASGMELRGWVWENIPLRTEVDMGGTSPMVTEATRLELGVAVPPAKFVIPADVVIKDEML